MDTSIGHALRLHDSGTNNEYNKVTKLFFLYILYKKYSTKYIWVLTAEAGFPEKVYIRGHDNIVGGTSHVRHPVT